MGEQNILRRLWTMVDEALDEHNMKKSEKALQLQAEVDLGTLSSNLDKAEAEFEQAVKEAKETRDFSKIRTAALHMKKEEKLKNEGIEVYKMIFKTEPKLI